MRGGTRRGAAGCSALPRDPRVTAAGKALALPPPPRSSPRPLPAGERAGTPLPRGWPWQGAAGPRFGCGAGDEELGGGGARVGEDRSPAAGSGPVAGVGGGGCGQGRVTPRGGGRRRVEATGWQRRATAAGQRRAGRGAPCLPTAPLPGRGIRGEVTPRDDSAWLRLRARRRQRSGRSAVFTNVVLPFPPLFTCFCSRGSICRVPSLPAGSSLFRSGRLSGCFVDTCWRVFLGAPRSSGGQ